MNPGIGSRYSYIDVVKLFFSLMIMLFHFGNNILPGGRVAVEGFFMISGFGNTLNQQFGLPLWIGYLIAVFLSVGAPPYVRPQPRGRGV